MPEIPFSTLLQCAMFVIKRQTTEVHTMRLLVNPFFRTPLYVLCHLILLHQFRKNCFISKTYTFNMYQLSNRNNGYWCLSLFL